MSVTNYNIAPYYDDYDPTKNYVQILAVAGKAEQSREFTQAATIIRDYMGRLGDAVFRNGAILDGCNLVFNEGSVSITAGRIYFAGLVRILYEDVTVPITGVGTELIGVKLSETIVTANQDRSLRNPAIGTEAYGLDGAHRVKQELVFTCNDSEATTIYHLEDGTLVAENVYEDTTMDVIVDVMARRTYDENGNFKIRGLELFEVPTQFTSDTAANRFRVGISAGKAYIKGYEVTKPSQSFVKLDKPLDFESVQDEPSTYINGVTEYPLNNYPVKELTRVNIVVQVTEDITRGSTQDGRDLLPHTPVKEILSVTQGVTEYIKGTDWQKIGNNIDWNIPGGDEPATGTTYQVTYQYTYSMEIGSEVQKKTKTVNGETRDYFKLVSNTHIPVVGTDIDVDYDFYLSRKDLILMDKNGEFSVLKGTPAVYNMAFTPINGDDSLLVIGSVLVMANSTEVYLVNEYTTRLTQAELYNLKRRIDDLEVSLAMTDLDREAADGEDATDLKGIYTDGFIGFSKCDLGHNEFDCSIDLDLHEMTLPTTNYDVVELTIDQDSEDTNCNILGRVVSAPYTEVECLNQPKASGTMLVNPYAVFEAYCPIKLDPEVDNWIDTEKITINKTQTKSSTVTRLWTTRGNLWSENNQRTWTEQGDTTTSTSVSRTSRVIADEIITYMRQRVVKVYASNFSANLDNIKGYFNEIEVPLTSRISSSYKPCKDSHYTGVGSQPGTVKACPHGHVWAQFTIPENQPCGSAKFVLVGEGCRGEAVYQANGRKQTVEETVLTTITRTTVMNVVEVTTPVDPLAQSFGFTKDTVLTSVDLYFAAKDNTKPCTIQVRNMVNGYPGTECYTQEILDADDVKISSDSSVPTNVKFSQPVYCKANTQYCVCILTDSNVYQMWVGELGQKDILTGVWITSNPYVEGVLFSSSNALTWTAHQTMDLKFKLYKANYVGRGSIRFNNVTASQMNRIVLAAQVVDYKNAGIEWWYRANSNENWKALDTYVAVDLTSVQTTFQLKCTLNVAWSSSPIMATDCVNLVYFLEGNSATYVSRMVETEEPFTNIKVMLQLALPAGCTADVYYMLESDQNPAWVKLTNPDTARVSGEWVQYTWTKSSISGTKYRVKIELHTTSPLIRPRARKLINILKY